MSKLRDDKITSLLTALAGKFIAEEAGRKTLITATRTEFLNDHKHATVFISVFPDDDAKHALSFLKRKKDEFRAYIKKNGRFSTLPFISFELDKGEQNRVRVEEISREIENK